jgi:hypothetical protein
MTKRTLLALFLVLGLAVFYFWFVSPLLSTKTPRQETSEAESNEPALEASAAPLPAEPSAPVVTTRATALPSVTAAPLSESQLMTQLRQVKDANPAGAIALAREGNRRFPDSADAPERASIVIHSLAQLERASEARGEAEDMVNHYPDSNWVREIEQFTGAHRHRNVRVNDAGQLEYY